MSLPDVSPQLEQRFAARMGTGPYHSASDLLEAALDALDAAERTETEKLEWLHARIDEGYASGIAEDFSFEAVRAETARRRSEQTSR